MYIKLGMIETQPNRLRGIPPECLTDIQDRPYIVNTIQNELLEIVFLNKEISHEHIDEIVYTTKETINDCFFTNIKNFWLTIIDELVINIKRYSLLEWFPKFSLQKKQDHYIITISNFCEDINFNKLKEFEFLNTTSLKDTKNMYGEQLQKNEETSWGWAGAGIYKIAKDVKRYSEHEIFDFISIKNNGEKQIEIIDGMWNKKIINGINATTTIKIPFPNV